MGFRVHAGPNPQTIKLIKDYFWDDICIPLLGNEYNYWNVWNSSSKLTTEGIEFLLNEIMKAKDGNKGNEENFNYFITFLKEAIDNNNYLTAY